MLKLSYSASGHVDEVNGMGLLRDKAWATDLDLPAFAVTAEQAAEQAAEFSSTAARSRPWRGTDPL